MEGLILCITIFLFLLFIETLIECLVDFKYFCSTIIPAGVSQPVGRSNLINKEILSYF